MEDVLTTNADNTATQNNDNQSSIITESIKNNIDPAEYSKMQELVKKLQSNFDRVNTEKTKYESELKKVREQNLTQKQLEELRQNELLEEIKQKEAELNGNRLNFEKTQYLYETKLDPEFVNLIQANDIDTFKNNVKTLSEKIKKIVLLEVDAEVNRRLNNANPNPQGNSNVKKEDIFSMDELQTLPKKMGQEWTKTNMEKIQRSLKYYNRK